MLTTKDEVLIKSQFVQVVRDGDRAVIWHSLFGNPRIVSEETIALLNVFSRPCPLGSVLNEYDFGEDGEEAIQDLIASHYLIPKDFDEREFLARRMQKRESTITNGSLIDNLELIMSEACNFRCTYCVHFNSLETSDRINNPKKFMTLETAKETVDNFLKIMGRQGKRVARGKARKVAEINFGGGEPLLVWPVIAQVLEYCRANYSHEFVFEFSINTNASLITPEIARKLKEYNVKIASSLDGLKEGNDKVRLTKIGGGTFESILRGFETLKKEEYPIDGIAVTVNEQNFPSLDEKIIDWAAQRQMRDVRIDIDIINMVEIPVEDIVAKLMRIQRYAHRYNIEAFGFWSRPVENLNESSLTARVAFCGAVRGNSMCISPSGNIYPCGYSTTQIGTLARIDSFHGGDGQYHRFVRDRLTGMIEMCRGCMIEGQCGGGCNITQEFAYTMKTTKIERMCDFYRQMTRELLLDQLRESCSK